MAKKDVGKSSAKGKHAPDDGGIKIVARNRKARHEYDLLEKVEAGIVLTGTEVKSLRNGKANLEDAYAEIDKLGSKTGEKGLTLVPLSIYFKKGIAKVELSVARGRKLYDKREAIKRQDAKRDMDRALRRR